MIKGDHFGSGCNEGFDRLKPLFSRRHLGYFEEHQHFMVFIKPTQAIALNVVGVQHRFFDRDIWGAGLGASLQR